MSKKECSKSVEKKSVGLRHSARVGKKIGPVLKDSPGKLLFFVGEQNGTFKTYRVQFHVRKIPSSANKAVRLSTLSKSPGETIY